MDLESLYASANPNIVIFLFTSFVAFLSWLVKSLVEKPILESKNTFNNFFEKRIEILVEVNTRLNFIAYFPKGKESEDFKKQLQEIILRDGKTGYLNKNTFDSILKISIDSVTDENLLLNTIKEINEDLNLQISKIQDEIKFYRRFSNFNPFRRFVGFALLSLQYVFSLIIVLSVLGLLIYGLIVTNWYWKVVIILLLIVGLYLINKWMEK
ncbi:MAG: hypothetical protein HXX14_13675 [Bacteroidetes bacterium]|nr:hypothetical protein [Bacteroidota bacterium]